MADGDVLLLTLQDIDQLHKAGVVDLSREHLACMIKAVCLKV